MDDKQLRKYDFGKNCVCVGRASTSLQNKTAQIEDLKKFARSLGYKKIQPFFTTESGFLEFDDKQGWNLVTDFFESHKDFRVLICSEMSRLSRRESILFKIKDYLKDNKIQLIIKDINFVLFNEWGDIPKGNDIVFALYASLADSEMRQKKERFKRALMDYKRTGYSLGGKRLFGYERYYERKDGKNRSRYRINEDEAEQIRTIFRWYAFGIDGDLTKTSVLEITKKCIEEGFSRYLHSKRNVNKCLKEQAYTGQKETHNRIHNAEYWSYRNQDKPKYVEGHSFICTYPAIFDGDDAALFDLVQQRLKENNSKLNNGVHIDKSTQHITILSKLVKCPNCGTYLHGEYRKRMHDNRRPHLGAQYSFSYRCNYSRGTVHNCDFKNTISMPLLDSVVWAYCKKAVLHTINSEEKKNVKEQLEEIDKRIANIDARIKDFNLESRIKAEEAILRGKTAVLKNPDAVMAAVKEFEQHVENLDKELNDFEKRKLELEQERESIVNSESIFGPIAKQANISSNKRLIYQYVHRLVDYIDIVFCNKDYSVLRVNLKHRFFSYRTDEYICIRKRTTKAVAAVVIHAVDKELLRNVTSSLREDNKTIEKMLVDSLPSKNDLYWNKESKLFEVAGIPFSLDELFSYYSNPLAYYSLPSEERVMHIDLSVLPISVKELKVERLTCYEEDMK